MPRKKLDLSDLKKLKVKDQEPPYPYNKAAKPKPEPAPEPEPEPDDDALFAQAMSGVNPMDRQAGRQVAPETPPPPPNLNQDLEADDRKVMEAFIRGELEFELEFTEEYMHGHVRGLDLKTFQKLKNGALSHEAHLDLHGMSADQAYDALLFFLRESYLQGKRCVLLIPGRGLGSPGGYGLLKRELQTWLTREPLRRIVLAFSTALPKDGGVGALYVLLRKKKKTQGKVKWEKMPGFYED